MVDDQEPRYRLVDADGNVVGSLFAESDGTLKLQEGTSGNDNELSLSTQGALEVEQLGVGPIGRTPVNAEESGSPYSGSGSSFTISNLEAFDTYLIGVRAADNGGAGNNLDLRLNGDSSQSYDEITMDGTRNTGQTEIGPLFAFAGNIVATGFIRIFRTGNNNIGIRNLAADAGAQRVNAGILGGGNRWPPSQVTLLRGEATDWTVRVYGADF